jgi:AcrR family transcriptional regulator
MQSTEASVYRYFENKHAVLIYLVCWYWQWVIYLIKINTLNIKDPKQKLKIIIHSFVAASVENPSVDYVDENKLHNVLIAEGKKAYHTKAVDKENKKQFFQDYKQLIAIVADVISELDPKFEYPHSLATSLFEMANDHIYFAQHLPRLTDIKVADNKYSEVEQMLNYFAAKLLGYKL